MAEYRWAHLRETAIQNWGSLPQGQLENDILGVFETQPALVQATINRIDTAYQAGKIRNPWAVLRADLAKTTSSEHSPVAIDQRTRDQAITAAEQWVRATGIHYPTETEILNYLFGTTETTPTIEYLETVERETRNNPGRYLYDGLLKASIRRTREQGPQAIPPTPDDGLLAEHRTDELKARIVTLWLEHRHTGQQLERDATDRGLAHQRNLVDQEQRRRARISELDDKQLAAD